MVALPSTAIITQSTVACQAAVFLLFHRGEGLVKMTKVKKMMSTSNKTPIFREKLKQRLTSVDIIFF